MAPATALADLPLEELRRRRSAARRDAELARLRARQGSADLLEPLSRLEADVRALTEELIARYAADLTLVDSLLEPAYPAKVHADDRRSR